MPGSTVDDVIVMALLAAGRKEPKQALAWYASTVVGPINLGLQDRVVLVTGGVRGVGAGISSVFAGQGAVVVTCARRPVDGLGYEFHSCDVRDPDSVGGLIDAIVERHGRLDVVVNNAGGSPYALAAEASPRFHQKVIELNLLGMLNVSLAANKVMQGQDAGGAIISVSSVSGRRPSPGTAAYGAAKAGVDSLTATLAVEWAPKVRVNAVVAGMVATEQVELFYGDSESQAAVAATVPLGRLARPDEIGWAAAFLASDVASYISGASLPVHGGGEPPPFLSASSANKD
jgi:NAD(P)-dependent dehydrogenase (short-subunit alcohol dehydrogenase family)